MAAEEGLAPRRAAFQVLEAVRAGRPLDAALHDALEPLPSPDRRLAHELAAGVLRHQAALDGRLRPLATRGWQGVAEPLRTVLRVGAYQLEQLDRVPAHAAVSTSVALAREVGGARAAGFVNALLRRLSRERRPAGPHDVRRHTDAAALAERHSHPEWLVRRWLARFGAAETERLLEWNNARPRLVLQPARRPQDAVAEALGAAGIASEPAPFGAGLVVPRGRPDEFPGYAEGAFLVQDPAQALVTWFADLPPGTLAYDACAAPGGKTIGLARTGVRVLAADASKDRVARLCQNLARAGSGRELAVAADALHPPVRAVDAVLLDAPCLGTGTFARHPDARGRVTPEALAELAERQRALLDAVAGVVRPGGLLVYATCSMEPEEDEEQVDRFLARHSEYRREPAPGFPAGLLTSKGDLMTLPQRDRIDGAYAARLRRSA
jgi:16S rRNA (cytosine967-C5)-methyltransferase